MIEKKIVLTASALFCFLMPISTKLANIGIILFIISMVWYIVKSKLYKSISLDKIVSLLFNTTAIIVLLLAIGLLYTEDFSNGVKYFENYSSYLIIPLLFSFVGGSLLIEIKNVAYRFFVFGSVVSSLILLLNNFIKYFLSKGNFTIGTDLFGYFYTYHEFTSLLHFHPTLLGVYLVFALIVLHEFQDNFLKRFKYLFSIIIFTCLVFLNSRSPFLTFSLYLLFCFIRLVKQNLYYNKGRLRIFYMFIATIAISVIVLLSFRKTYIYQRFSSQLVWELTENKGTSYNGVFSNDSRVSRWKALFNKAMDRPAFGYGAGSEDRIVLEAYEKYDLQYALKSKYGSHNQYLSFLLEYGFLGIILFTYFVYMQVRKANRAENTISLLLISLIFIACFFDSILYLNTCVIFVAFFFNLNYFKNSFDLKESKV